MNGIKDAFLEGHPKNVDFPIVQSKDIGPTITTLHPIINRGDEILVVSDGQPKRAHSKRRVSFPKHLNDYYT